MRIGIGNTTTTLQGKGSFPGIITEWTVGAGETITLHGQDGGNYLFDVDWGDGTEDTGLTTNSETHTYASAGTYEVKILGQFAGFKFFSASAADRQKLTSFVQWGTETVIEGLLGMFRGCSNMTYLATDTPTINLNPAVTLYNSAERMFESCSAITYLDVSQWVINGGPLIYLANAFRQLRNCEYLNVSNWDLSGFQPVASAGLSSFMEAAGADTVNGCDILFPSGQCNFYTCSGMFFYAKIKSLVFEPEFIRSGVTIGNCFLFAEFTDSTVVDLTNVTGTSNIESMGGMFQGSNVTELNVSNWDFSNVGNMNNFFRDNTTLTNIDFPSSADYSSLTLAYNMVTTGASITTAEYDNLLIRLDTTGQKGGTYGLNAGDSTYTGGGAAATARANLAAGGWAITDGGIA